MTRWALHASAAILAVSSLALVGAGLARVYSTPGAEERLWSIVFIGLFLNALLVVSAYLRDA